MQPEPVVVSHRADEPPMSDSYWICGYGCPLAWNGPAYSKAVGWSFVPFGQEFAR